MRVANVTRAKEACLTAIEAETAIPDALTFMRGNVNVVIAYAKLLELNVSAIYVCIIRCIVCCVC